jgi:5,10-methylenetetrahydrofolate reductase
MESESPIVLLKDTCIKLKDELIPLDNREAINEYVRDVLDLITGHRVLAGILGLVNEFNFEFLNNWHPIHIPSRLCSTVIEHDKGSFDDDPIMSLLVSNQYATMKELEEYYSLEDAFRMYDILVESNLSKALTTESVYKESKRKS